MSATLSTSVDSAVVAVTQQVDELRSTVEELCASAKRWGDEKGSEATAAVKDAAAEYQQRLEPLVRNVVEQVRTLYDQTLSEESRARVAALAAKAAEALETAQAKVAEAKAMVVSGELRQAVEDHLQAMKTQLQGQAKLLKDRADEVRAQVEEKVRRTQDDVTNEVTELKATLQRWSADKGAAASDLRELAGPHLERLNTASRQLGERVNELYVTSIDAASRERVDALVAQARETVEQAAAKLTEASAGVQNGELRQTAEQLYSSSVTALRESAEAVRERADRGYTAVNDLRSSIETTVRSRLASVSTDVGSLQKAVAELRSGGVSGVKESLAPHVERVRAGMDQLHGRMVELYQQNVDADARAQLEGSVEQLQAAVKKAEASLRDVTSSASEHYAAEAAAMLTEASERLNALSRMRTVGSLDEGISMARSLLASIGAQLGDVSRAAKEWSTTKSERALEDLRTVARPRAESIGRNIRALSEGMHSMYTRYVDDESREKLGRLAEQFQAVTQQATKQLQEAASAVAAGELTEAAALVQKAVMSYAEPSIKRITPHVEGAIGRVAPYVEQVAETVSRECPEVPKNMAEMKSITQQQEVPLTHRAYLVAMLVMQTVYALLVSGAAAAQQKWRTGGAEQAERAEEADKKEAQAASTEAAAPQSS